LIDIEGKSFENLPQSVFHPAIKVLSRIGNLCNNAHISNGEHLGQPTEVALLEFGNLLNIRDERSVSEFYLFIYLFLIYLFSLKNYISIYIIYFFFFILYCIFYFFLIIIVMIIIMVKFIYLLLLLILINILFFYFILFLVISSCFRKCFQF